MILVLALRTHIISAEVRGIYALEILNVLSDLWIHLTTIFKCRSLKLQALKFSKSIDYCQVAIRRT